jgi:hypothetical protein
VADAHAGRLLSAAALLLLVSCAHTQLRGSHQPCDARIEETQEDDWLRVVLFNTSRSPASGLVTRLSIGFAAVPKPLHVAEPPGWSATTNCSSDTPTCEVEWVATADEGLGAGGRLAGFDVRFAAAAPTSGWFSARLGTCMVGGVSGRVVS